MVTPEKRYEKKLRLFVEMLGGLALKIYCQIFTGLPDRLLILPGGGIEWVEVKSDGKKPSPRQMLVHDQLRRLGFRVWVVDSEESLNDLLHYLKIKYGIL